MSPYRVLVVNSNDSRSIMSTMLKTDKETDRRDIYVLVKAVSGLDETESVTPYMKKIAHKMSGKLNSKIVGHYRAFKDFSMRRYQVDKLVHTFGKGDQVYSTNIIEFTLQDCLRAVMQDYCTKHDLRIVQEL